MSMTLNIVDSLLNQGQKLHKLGRVGDAHHILLRLSGLCTLPAEAAEMSQAMLAEIYLKRRQYKRARRCLTAALTHRADCARYHFQLAQAWEDDDKGDRQLAVDHYTRSLELDPEQPECHSRLGLLLVEMGREEEGLEQLRQAVESAPQDPALLERQIEGLRLAGRDDEARSALLAARFRNPRDRRFHKLWNNYQFQELHRRQQTEAGQTFGITDDGPVVLPFVRLARPDDTRPRTKPVRKILRQDPPKSPRPFPRRKTAL